MMSLKPISSSNLIKAFLTINLVLLSLSIFNASFSHRTLIQTNFTTTTSQYHFADPELAYKILTQLDTVQPWDNNGWNKTYATRQYRSAFFGLTNDYKYCEKHRAYFTNNPGYVFSQVNFMSSFDGLVRKQLQAIGNDIMPNTTLGVKPKSPRAVDIKPEVNLIVTWGEMNNHRQPQTQYSCLGQMSNHIPGLKSIKTKDNLAENIYQYAANYQKTNRTQCFQKLFPKTFSLVKEDQCKQFFEEFNSQEYQRKKADQKVVYFRKIGAELHGGDGVFAVDDKEEKYIRELYQNGELCGQIRDNNLMQYYISNPLLLNGRKFDFRLYMLIASVNPFIVYYHDGLLRVSLTDYDPKNTSRASLLPNGDETDTIIRRARLRGKYLGKTADELREEYMWSFERLQDYLLENGYTTDPNWLENYLRPELKKTMAHLIRMSRNDYLKVSSVYELQGLDFILDENLNLWFIEANPKPAIEEATPHSKELFKTMFLDQYEIVIGLLRSRMKRVYEYVNHIVSREEAGWSSVDKIYIKNLNEKKAEFQQVIKNYFEPEFEPREGNSFTKIVDENYSGVKRYAGLISEECL